MRQGRPSTPESPASARKAVGAASTPALGSAANFAVLAYTVLDATTRRIEGTAKVNGRSGVTYQVDVSDAGEPGRDDTFALRLSTGYGASGVLRGGNVQLHVKAAQSGPCDHGGDDDDHEDDDGHDEDDDDHDGGRGGR